MLRIALLLSLLLAAPASAATVSSTASTFYDPGGKGFPETWITTRTIDVAAAPGEANRVVVAAGAGVVTVTDAGGALSAGAGCATAEGGAVTCATGGASVLRLTAHLDDGDDRLEVPVAGMRVTVDAGSGADLVTAGAGGEVDGGDGDDVLALGDHGTLRGGPGADTLTGSGAYDVLDGGVGTDVIDGGAGVDTLSYAGRADGVVVDLTAPTAGAPGEEDRIAGVESARGGEGADLLVASAAASGGLHGLYGGGGDDVLRGAVRDDVLDGGDGADVLRGDARDDILDGGDGADRLEGLGGSDSLDGGPGDDVLDGGDGPDRITGRAGADLVHGGSGRDELSDLGDDGAADVYHGDLGNDDVVAASAFGGPGDDTVWGVRVDGGPGDDRLSGRRVVCAAGRDTVVEPADRFVIPGDCERVEPWTFGGTTLRVPPRIAGRVVQVRMPNPCLYAYAGARCRVKATLFVGGRWVGRREARWRSERAGARVVRFVVPRRVRGVLWLRLVKYETGESVERGGYSVRTSTAH